MKDFRFISTAIKLNDSDSHPFVVRGGARHSNALFIISEKGLFRSYQEYHEDGFIVSVDGKEEFFNRYQSTNIARRIGIKLSGDQLISEDLW